MAKKGQIQKPKKYWTFERCAEKAYLCKQRSEFHIKYSSAYNVSRKNNWLDKICQHMIPVGNRYKKIVYAYEFPDKSVYVGLTYNENLRFTSHIANQQKGRKSPVFLHINETGLNPIYKRITKDYIDVHDAQQIEEETVNLYTSKGWRILNKAKTGGIGGTIKFWTKEKCAEKVQLCRTKTEFQKKYNAAYKSAYRHGWLKELFINMPEIIKPNGYWTKNQCRQEARKYLSRSEFSNNSSGAYDKALINGWLNDICKHMKKFHKPNGYWTKDNVKKEALKYKTRTEFSNKSSGAYTIALKNNWINEVCIHMQIKHKPNRYWTKEVCLQKASECKTKKEFYKNFETAYNISLKNGWINEMYSYINN